MGSITLAGRTLLTDSLFAEATVRVQDGRFDAIRSGIDSSADILTSGWIIPGLIDLQVNGGFRFDVTADPTTASALAGKLPATGVTSFLPTVITSALESYPALLRALEQSIGEAHGANILGVHVEGPYLSPQRAGAHNPALLRPPSVEEYDRWLDSKSVRLFTLAPELPGALALVEHLAARGIVVSAGHSNASYAEATAGFEAGITWGTHLFNAMSPLAHREPGLVGALLSAEVPCGLIVDGIHVHPAVVKTAWRARGTRGLTLVTDAMSAAGMAPGQYVLGDRQVVVDSTSARLADGTLAGSILQMDAAVRNVMAYTGCSLADAVRMATATPARVLGISNHKGLIAPGYDADLVVLDESLRVSMTMIGGTVAYKREE